MPEVPEEKTEEGAEEETSRVHQRETFRHSVDEGKARLERSALDLAATGFVGGLDVSLGILAALVVVEATGSPMLAALAFSIGLIAVTFGKSELFTENFLVPVAAVVAKKARVPQLLRLWVGTAIANLVGAWLFAWLIVLALPKLHRSAIERATHFAELGLVEMIALGIIAGMAITFMTWMEHGAKSEFGKVVAVTGIAFLLAATPLAHVVVMSAEMFAALHTGAAPFTYLDWARLAGIATLANAVGGLLLVTTFRLAQVGEREIRAEQRRPEGEPREEVDDEPDGGEKKGKKGK